MFKWFKRKSVKMLIVVDNDAHSPIDYCNKVDVDIKTEIRAACNSLAIEHDEKLISLIAEAFENNEAYWIKTNGNAEFGFQLLEVEV